MTLVCNRYDRAGDQGRDLPIDEALGRAWSWDAHFAQYSADRRLSKTMVSEQPMIMRLAVFDFDCPDHAPLESCPDFAEPLVNKIPRGWQAYLTAGGFRVLTHLPAPLVIDSPERWEEWRAMHAGLGRALSDALGREFDPACSDPSRLFRLPNVVRDGGKPCYPELIGALGVSELPFTPAAPRAATAISTGPAEGSILGQVFASLGWVQDDAGEKLTVRCPWAHEHSDPGQDTAVVYASEDGLGKFHCGHTHCAGRGSTDVIDAVQHMPGAAETLARNLYTRTPPAAPPHETEPRVTQPEARFLDWDAICAPMGEVPWLVKDLELCPGRPPMFVSDSGVGKTWTLQALALSVATGQPVFGRFPCRQGPVLHLSRDSGLRATKKRYQRLARGMGIDRADVVVFPHNLPLTDKFGQFQRKGFEEIAKEAVRGGYALVILDSLAALCPGIDENSTDIGDPLRCTTDDDCVWLWAHHTTKSGEGYRGSGAIKAAAGAIYVGSRDGDDVKWTPLKASEEHESGELPTFHTQWVVDNDGFAARIEVVDRDPDAFGGGADAAQKAAWEMLALLEQRGKVSATDLLAAAGAPPGVKGRIRTRANAVLGYLARPGAGMIIAVEGARYILAPGAVVPKAAHQIVVSVDEKHTR